MYDTHTHTLLQEEKMLRGSCGLLELDWLGWVFPRLNSVDFTEKKFELGDVELTLAAMQELRDLTPFEPPKFKDPLVVGRWARFSSPQEESAAGHFDQRDRQSPQVQQELFVDTRCVTLAQEVTTRLTRPNICARMLSDQATAPGVMPWNHVYYFRETVTEEDAHLPLLPAPHHTPNVFQSLPPSKALPVPLPFVPTLSALENAFRSPFPSDGLMAEDLSLDYLPTPIPNGFSLFDCGGQARGGAPPRLPLLRDQLGRAEALHSRRTPFRF
ncbi:hypothetical protein PAPYR_4730 [Paratrimastix pyriformis]|uniref:Uncharacterized protein n=1 Tax=Paratrimastix pyriformis TaxID=342808 RepID=A0ABQ8UJ12_9EUKA|nr:hypothetical protein PAPYR_4730 [Paratrimastix pyriformis]